MSIIRSAWAWRSTVTCTGCHREIHPDEPYYQVQQGLLDDLMLAVILQPHCYHARCLDAANLVLSLAADETLCVTYIQS
jgi:hypothetical protein